MITRGMRTASTLGLRRSFSLTGVFRSLLNVGDKDNKYYQIAHHDPTLPVTEFAGNTAAPAESKIEYTVLPNGVTVVSENSALPGPVHFKILLNVGTRNENTETSGSLHSIKNTYLKTVVNTNETVNYGMVQMGGGYSSMKYDQETAIFSAGCIAHDAVDIFGMIADCALEPRSIVSANVSMHKSKQNFKLERAIGTGLDFNDAIFRTAYGGRGLGNPILGLESNVDYLTAMRIQRFQLENITPQRIFIGGANVENHSEFVDLVAQKLSFITPLEGRQTKDAEPSEYIGGSYIQSDGSNDTHIGLLYEAPSWKSQDSVAVRVAAQILGSFTDGLTGVLGANPYTRAYRDLLSNKAYINHAGALNFTFSDSGLFGIGLTGSASHAGHILEDGQTQLRRLAEDISDEDVALAKAALKVKVLRGIETPVDRLDETLRNFRVYGGAKHQEYENWINQVSTSQVRDVVKRILAGRPTLVALGGNVGHLSVRA